MNDCPPTRELSVEEWHQEYLKLAVYTIKALSELDEARHKNARLLELVRDLYSCGDSCTHCRHWNQGDGFYCNLGVGWKAKRMRELGVEVDE